MVSECSSSASGLWELVSGHEGEGWSGVRAAEKLVKKSWLTSTFNQSGERALINFLTLPIIVKCADNKGGFQPVRHECQSDTKQSGGSVELLSSQRIETLRRLSSPRSDRLEGQS